MSVTDAPAVERAPGTARRMAEAAQGLLQSLNARQRERLHLPFGDDCFVWDWLPGETRSSPLDPRSSRGAILPAPPRQATHTAHGAITAWSYDDSAILG